MFYQQYYNTSKHNMTPILSKLKQNTFLLFLFGVILIIPIFLLGNYFSKSDIQVAPTTQAQAEYASTHSFTNTPGRGTYPSTLTLAYNSQLKMNQVTVDLSSLPKDSVVHRAVLVPHRKGNYGGGITADRAKEEVKVESIDKTGEYLPILGPRFLSLDATAAVQRAIGSSNQKLTLNAVSFPALGESGGSSSEYIDSATSKVVLRLDVTVNKPAVSTSQKVSEIKVNHRDGDTMITWKDPAPFASSNTLSGAEIKELMKQINNPKEIRYRVYRSTQPITAANIGQAELVNEVDPLSVWDWRYFDQGIRDYSKEPVIPLYPVDSGVLASYDMGMYVRKSYAPEKSYYAVSRVVDGEENLSDLTSGGNVTAAAVDESPGKGMVLLREKKTGEKFQFVNNAALNYYVKWEAPPSYNFPEPFDYLVAEPPTSVAKKPIDVALHCWGGWLNNCYGWWYRPNDGALLVSTNQAPFDWWSGFNENYGTLKPFTKGVVQNYSQRRIRNFLDDFVLKNWDINTDEIMLSGVSMGGSGASSLGIRGGDYFSQIDSWVGVHIPAESPQFTGSYEGVYGKYDWGIKYEDTNSTVWDYKDNTQWLRNNIKTETPHMVFANGKNDGAIGWPQAWKFVKAMIETKRPFTFSWGQSGHGTRANFPGAADTGLYPGMVFRLNQSVPAFANGSLDDNLGDAPENAVDAGKMNYWYLWDTENIVDSANQWVMTFFLPNNAPQTSATVDMTPRKLQSFIVTPGAKYNWTNMENGAEVQSGTVTADSNGLITLLSVKITKDKNKITITPNNSPGPVDVTAPSAVGNLSASNTSQTQTTLAWTAPGDDGATGKAAFYDLRYSTTVLNEAGWASALKISGEPFPENAGTSQSMAVNNLQPGKTYYFAIKATDESGNTSTISNVAQVVTEAATVPNSADLNNDGAIDEQDLLIMKNNFNTDKASNGDITKDGIIDVRDLGMLFSGWSKK